MVIYGGLPHPLLYLSNRQNSLFLRHADSIASSSISNAFFFQLPTKHFHHGREIMDRQPKDVTAKRSHSRHLSVTVKSLPRRLVLQLMGFTPISLCTYPLFAAPMLDMNEPEVIRTFKLPNGVKIQEIVEGEGPEAHDGDYVQVNYVCRRSNGYFVHSTVDQFSGESSPVNLPLDDDQIIKGLKDVLTGMKVGGKRRALIPPSVGYIDENLKPIPNEFGPRRSLLSHANEPLIFEVQLLKIL